MTDTLRTFRRITLSTLGLFLLVAVAGVTVRVLEAGMGCPDWPTCYGQLIPPLHESELPADYRERFAVAGKLAEPFDPLKTWAEYINRLLAVVAGVAVLAMVGYAWIRLRTHPQILLYASAVPILLITQALLGWRVVATYLAEYMVTIHMLFSIALLIVVILAWAQTLRLGERKLTPEIYSYYRLGQIAWIALIAQVILGTMVRTAVNQQGPSFGMETPYFLIHRSFSWIVLGLWAYYQWRLYREPTRHPLARRTAIWTTIALFLQVITGASMYYIQFSAFLRVVHLLWALCAISAGFASLYLLPRSAFLYENDYEPIPKPSP
ncbi:MAG: COX15/CtaA family protein [Bacteroidia bacterium]|nr:COX15/CtaA family protein [Bacteroidia bacterium]MDW8235850.1 COX15/CtaA family protein [Bacteroidia bacterium]